MKRFIALLLLTVTLTFSLASCNKPDTTDGEWKYKYVTAEAGFIIGHNVDNTSPNVGCYDALLINYDCDTKYDIVSTTEIHTEIHKVKSVRAGTIYVSEYFDETQIILERIYARTGSLGKDLSEISISESNTQLTDEWASIVSNAHSVAPHQRPTYYDKTEIIKYLKN